MVTMWPNNQNLSEIKAMRASWVTKDKSISNSAKFIRGETALCNEESQGRLASGIHHVVWESFKVFLRIKVA